MELVAAATLVGALTIPGWLFKRVPVWVGSVVSLVLYFCAGFFWVLTDDSEATAWALTFGGAAGAVGGAAFFLARRLEVWEREHPVDMERLSPAQQRIRRIGIPLAVLSFVWMIGGAVTLVFGIVSVVVWVFVGAALFLLCGVLWFSFVRSGTSRS